MLHQRSEDKELLHKAEAEIIKKVRLFSGCRLTTTEKYGIIRYTGLYLPIKRYGFLTKVWYRLGMFVTKVAVLTTANKYAKIREEILDDLNWFLE